MANLANCKISLQDAMDYREDLIDRKSMQAVRTVACCQRKNVDDDFVNEVVDGKPV